MRMVRFGLYLVGVTLLLTGSAIGQAPATTLRVGLVASVSDAGFFVPMERGYFAEQGLAIEFVPFRSAADMIAPLGVGQDRKSTRLNSSHQIISYAVFCL